MPGHRAAPNSRWDLYGSLASLDAGRILLLGLGVIAASGSAFAALITTQIQPQVEKVQRQVNAVPGQLDAATADLEQGLADAGARLTDRARDSQADLDRLTAALRALQGDPAPEPTPKARARPERPAAAHPAAVAPTRTPTAAPDQDPVAAMCTALQLQCTEQEGTE